MAPKKDQTEAQFSFEYVALLLASIEQKHGSSGRSPDAKIMSALSRGGLNLTVFAIDHQLRPIRKRVKELVEQASNMASSGDLQEVESPSKKTGPKASKKPTAKPAAGKKRKAKELKRSERVNDDHNACDNEEFQNSNSDGDEPLSKSRKKSHAMSESWVTNENGNPESIDNDLDLLDKELLRLAGDDFF